MGGSTSLDMPTTIGLPLWMTMSDTVIPAVGDGSAACDDSDLTRWTPR